VPESRPEPVRNAAVVASSVTAITGLILTLLVVTHVLTPDDSEVLGPALASAIPTVVGAVSAVVAALRARLKVTPLDSPRDAEGGQLVPLADYLRAQGIEPQTPGEADHAAPEE
jgi:hypothetical protein